MYLNFSTMMKWYQSLLISQYPSEYWRRVFYKRKCFKSIYIQAIHFDTIHVSNDSIRVENTYM